MRILGVDTSLRCTGYGLIDVSPDGRLRAVDCGIIRNKASLSQAQCLGRLAEAFEQLCDLHKPQVAAIESTFYSRNAKTAMILGMARGAVISVLNRRNLELWEYAPSRAKQALTGSGDASKAQVASVVAGLLGIDPSAVNDDATDALALAVAHAHALHSPLGLKMGKQL